LAQRGLRWLTSAMVSTESGLVHVVGVNLRQSVDGNALTLFHGKGVIGGFEFDVGADQAITLMNIRLETHCVWVQIQLSVQPSKERLEVGTQRIVEIIFPLSKTAFAQRNPDAPCIRFLPAMHRDLKAATHEKLRVVDHATVTAYLASALPLGLGNLVIRKRCVGAEAWHARMGFIAGMTFELELHGLGIDLANNTLS